ncbi:MAG: substrate-binding domain-containing protein [Verrucomicrobiota bacterium]
MKFLGVCAALFWNLSLSLTATEPAFIWPSYGSGSSSFPTLNGHTNSVPDIVGRVDGTADLVIFTEGNHFPVLLPLVYDAFPEWLSRHSEFESKPNPDICVVTLPQYLIVEAMIQGGMRLGNLVLPVQSNGPWFPDLVMGGEAPLKKLCRQNLVDNTAFRLARHRGPALLVQKGNPLKFSSLEDLSRDGCSWVMATETEAGARHQYLKAMQSLLPKDISPDILLKHERQDFNGRLRIQHRDIPFAVANGRADAGLIFRHLAHYYANMFPDLLSVVEVEGAESFSADIYVTTTARSSRNSWGAVFVRFLREAAPEAYPRGGFQILPKSEFGESLDLSH